VQRPPIFEGSNDYLETDRAMDISRDIVDSDSDINKNQIWNLLANSAPSKYAA
jgi:hypothetical protein